jgi:hypothetical protein
MEVTMRLGKEQAAGYVEDIETEVAEPVTASATVVAAAPEHLLSAEEPVALPR